MTTDQARSHLNAKDIAFGLLLLAIAAGALYVNQDYEAGTASRMGPGYMPMLVFGLTGLFGIGMLITAFRSGPDPLEKWAWREMGLVLSAMTAFGALLNTLGLGLCVVILVTISSFADRSQTLKGAMGLTATLVVLCWLIFDRGLKIGIPFLPPILGLS
jgi:Tripartite tricarboxylate transporter TctB family